MLQLHGTRLGGMGLADDALGQVNVHDQIHVLGIQKLGIEADAFFVFVVHHIKLVVAQPDQ